MLYKDHYKTLGLPTNASLQQVKKAYRKLAHQYHPDKNHENIFAANHFREIQEAYDVLSDVQKREQYDEERFFAGLSVQKDPIVITPAWILKEIKKLTKRLAFVDSFRMNHKALHDYIFLLLSDSHLAILKHENNGPINKQIILEILIATKNLPHQYFKEVAQRLNIIADSDTELLKKIQGVEREKKQRFVWERYLPLFIMILTLALCLLMYWYSHKKI